MITEIRNGEVIENGSVIKRSVFFEDGKITDANKAADKVIDASGLYVSAGWIDLHLHGGNNFDFMDATEEAFESIALFHARHGTTAMCPTTTSGDFDETRRVLDVFDRLQAGGHKGADFIGMHLEGPYFADSQRGAQDPKYIHPPVKEEYEGLLKDYNGIVRWSSAPELDESFAFSEYLTMHGVKVSAGHTDCSCATLLNASGHGYKHMTHLYSCMKSVERKNGMRIAGAIEGAYLDDTITVEIIADGMHLPQELIQLVFKLKGSHSIALITDAMRGAGLPNGSTSFLGSTEKGQKVYIEKGVAWLPDFQAFAGSVATYDRLIRTCVSFGIPLADAITSATEAPARIIGAANKGRLKAGFDADIVIFDKAINVQNVFIRGNEIQ